MFLKHNFGTLSAALDAAGVRSAHGMLFDLGISSPQLDDPARGFSFRADGPLDMRMDPGEGVSAAQWLATAEEQEIRRVMRDYGEERFAKQIAAAIVAARSRDRIVKRFMQHAARPDVPRELPLRAIEMPQPALKLIGRAIRPSAAETAANPRARSATLRVAERAAAPYIPSPYRIEPDARWRN